VIGAAAALDHCAVADSFGDLDLARHGFEVLIEATWLHRPPDDEPGAWPDGWSVVTRADDLAEWVTAHDHAGVLTPAVLDHPRFRVLECRRNGRLVGGAVTHDGDGALGLSNGWGAGEVGASTDVLAAVSALYPGRAVVDMPMARSGTRWWRPASHRSARNASGRADTPVADPVAHRDADRPCAPPRRVARSASVNATPLGSASQVTYPDRAPS
jgi:hypothetical protein